MSCPKESRDTSLLIPAMQVRVKAYFTALKKKFPQFDEFIITETFRTHERQKCLNKTGESLVKRSNHQLGQAVDWVPVRDGKLDYRPAVFRNIYRLLDPREFGLTSGAHLWDWDEGHLQMVECQGPGKDLGDELETYR